MRNLKTAALAFATGLILSGTAWAENYVIDTKDAHASINFRVQHLGYSWLTGRFDKFEGSFDFDEEDASKSSVEVKIDTSSLNSNHAARDKHLRSGDFLNTDKFPEATFTSTSITKTGDKTAVIKGDLTLLETTKEVELTVNHIGGGDDPWGGFRQGFEGSTQFVMEDFGIKNILGPASAIVYLDLHIEGVKQ